MNALLFDMDGVVVDSEDYWHAAERDELLPAVLDGAVPDLDEITGMPYREEVRLLDGFDEIRTAALGAEVSVGLVSSSPPHWVEYVVDRFGLAFDLTLSDDHVDGPGKPEPGIYETAAERLGVDVADCVAVEDSENGSRAAARADMTVVGYRVEHNAETDPSACDVVCSGPAALRDELLRRLPAEN